MQKVTSSVPYKLRIEPGAHIDRDKGHQSRIPELLWLCKDNCGGEPAELEDVADRRLGAGELAAIMWLDFVLDDNLDAQVERPGADAGENDANDE